jgi:hypothetical protein
MVVASPGLAARLMRSIVSLLFLLFLPFFNNASAYNNNEIKDPKKCINLVGLFLPPKSQPYYLGTKRLAGEAARYDAVPFSERIASDPIYRSMVAKTEGRLFLKSAVSPEGVSRYFQGVINNPKILFAVPYDEKGVKHVYGENLDEKSATLVLKSFGKARGVLGKKVGVHWDDSSKRLTVKKIHEYIDAKDESQIVLVAHSDGGLIKLPSGESLDINSLQKRASAHQKLLLVISCNTIDDARKDFSGLVTIDTLNFDGIAKGVASAESKRATHEEKSIFVGDYIYFMDQGIRAQAEANHKSIRLVMVAAAGATGVTATYSLNKSDEKGKDK